MAATLVRESAQLVLSMMVSKGKDHKTLLHQIELTILLHAEPKILSHLELKTFSHQIELKILSHVELKTPSNQIELNMVREHLVMIYSL